VTDPVRYRPTSLEVAWATPLGRAEGLDRLPRVPRDLSAPRRALERSILDALRHPPCVVSFSGGRDSSALLALSVHLARKHGLPEPLPVTLVIVGSAEAEESSWQHAVLQHLGITDWHRIPVTGELDIVGPVADRYLMSAGVVLPFNAHFHDPMFALARAGSLITGFGGDEILGSQTPGRARQVLAGRARPVPRDLLRIGLLAVPPPVRARVLQRRVDVDFEWLTGAGRAQLARTLARHQAHEPSHWGKAVRSWWRGRYRALIEQGLAVVAQAHAAQPVHPFVDPDFLAAMAAVGGATGLGSRQRVLDFLIGDLLPNEVLARTSKAVFDAAMWTSHSRRMIAEWDGSGVDVQLVDVDALRQVWSRARPDARTAALLQQVWLGSQSRQLLP
jgi:hypothetical protein